VALVIILCAIMVCAAAFYFLSDDGGGGRGELTNRYIVFVDQSASIPETQQAQWEKVFGKLLDRLKGGDAFAIFGIHDQSLNAKPIFQAEVPVLEEGAGLDDWETWKRRLNQIRNGAKESFNKALHPERRALSTDIFSAINRVQPDRTRKTSLILMSDMIHSTRELDMEKTRLAGENIAGILNPVIGRHQWRKGALEGVEVHCVLNSVELHETSPLNDRLILRRFWTALFDNLGAKVMTFETHLTL
jgi:hypothetical protein